MHITLTNTKETAQGRAETEKFLSDFLPRFRKYPGVKAVYSYYSKEKGEGITITIWENEEAVKSYWNSELINETKAFSEKSNVPITRESHPLFISLG